MAPVIRSYHKKDRAAVIELLRLNVPDFFASSEEEDLRDYLDTKREDYFVVEEDHEITGAGGINYFPEERTARLSWDIVKPASQGKGIGKLLTEHRIKLLNKNPEVDTIVVRTSQLVHKFYEKFGFSTKKIIKDFWAENIDLYHMELKNEN